ncbi:hypothetical protein [Prochlorococcus marinus]|nr:hypothetical protein [Prochlorococcus marinus]
MQKSLAFFIFNFGQSPPPTVTVTVALVAVRMVANIETLAIMKT